MNKKPKLSLAEQKARDSRLRRLRAEFNGTLTRGNRPEYRQFTFDNLKKKS